MAMKLRKYKSSGLKKKKKKVILYQEVLYNLSATYF